jgi:hypothetical protein
MNVSAAWLKVTLVPAKVHVPVKAAPIVGAKIPLLGWM